MKSWKKPTNEMIDKAFRLVKKGTGRRYFFSRLSNPLWIQPLVKRGIFQSPPKIRYFDDGYVQFPRWPELQYLKNVSCDVPDQVVNLVLGLPKVDNPSVYDDIMEIALQLHGEESKKLMPKILESLELEPPLKSNQYVKLLSHWAKENQVEPALALSKILVAFLPDSQERDKRKRRRENQQDLDAIATMVAATQLEPSPRIGSWEYGEILSKCIRVLAEKEPYKVAILLIDTTADMICLRTHQDDLAKNIDFSDAWCERLFDTESDHADPENALIYTLTAACETVYQISPDAVVALDTELRYQKWRVFKRLRQHLYAQYPSQQTKPWIQELILAREDYHRWEHPFEFQQMIRSACEHFGTELLTEEELKHIFDCIRRGPSKDNLTENKFRQLQRRFHRKQLMPFAPVLSGEYKTYFQQLETAAEDEISDDDYPPLTSKGGLVVSRSPHSSDDLANLTDKGLLNFINEWEGEDPIYEGNDLIEFNIEGLANAFQSVFREQIIPDFKRLKFWMENREKIARPIYVRMMIVAMQTDVNPKHFDKLSAWLSFSEWVLSHPDQDLEEDYRLGRQGDESRENPNWYNSRRAVGDFIEECLKEEVDVPISARRQLSTLLEMLCTQYDSWLDRDKRRFLNQNDLITEGINNTRSRALEALIQFGFWVRRHDSESEVPELTAILEKRFASETGQPLTLPEYAILGRDYRLIYSLNEAWATEHKSDFFAQGNLSAWLAAFDSYMRYNRPRDNCQFKAIFEILRDDYDFALRQLGDFKNQDFSAKTPTAILGEHLFHYYLLEMYPLGGENSLLARFYEATEHDRKQWASLFDYVGRSLRDSGEQLGQILTDRIITFFDWRIQVREPIELEQFTFWLKAKCLAPEWRLGEYSKILDVCTPEKVSISMQLEVLCEMLPDHKAKVVECFAKLTHGRGDDNIYIRTEEAKKILNAVLASDDEKVKQNAAQAHENLLRLGRFDLLDLDD